MRIFLIALLAAATAMEANAQTVQIAAKGSTAPTLEQSFQCAAVYAIAAQGIWKQTSKPDAEMRAALRGWLTHIRATSTRTNAELNQDIRPVVQTISGEIAEGSDIREATLARRSACSRFEGREAAPQPASAAGGGQ